MGEHIPPVHHVEGGQAPVPGEVGGADIALLQAEGEDGPLLPLQGVHGVGVVGIGHNDAALRHPVGEGAEGVLHVVQILEEVQVIGLDVEDHRHGGEEGEEGVAVLTGLQDDGLPLAHPVAGADGGQGAADHHSGVQPCGQKDVGAHRGGGGLSVGPRHTQGVVVVPHDGSPRLGPLEDGDAQPAGGGDLRVVIMDGGGADDAVRPLHALRQVADGHRDPQRPQVLHRPALVGVGAGDAHPRPVEHLCQRGHGHPSYPHQMGGPPGLNIVMYLQGHVSSTSPQFFKILRRLRREQGLL